MSSAHSRSQVHPSPSTLILRLTPGESGHGGRGEGGKDGQEGSRAWRGPNVMRRKDHSGLEENGLCAEEDRETVTLTLTQP